MKNLLLAAIAVATLGVCSQAQAVVVVTPPTVNETVTGSAGNWTLDFTLTNNLSSGNNLYFFGVQTDTTDVISSPGGFGIWDGGATWSGIYNNVWWNQSSPVTAGATLGGFEVYSTDATAPTALAWFAYANGGNLGNPGFSGTTIGNTVTSSAVPEPASMALLGAGIFGLGMIRRRKAV